MKGDWIYCSIWPPRENNNPYYFLTLLLFIRLIIICTVAAQKIIPDMCAQNSPLLLCETTYDLTLFAVCLFAPSLHKGWCRTSGASWPRTTASGGGSTRSGLAARSCSSTARTRSASRSNATKRSTWQRPADLSVVCLAHALSSPPCVCVCMVCARLQRDAPSAPGAAPAEEGVGREEEDVGA
jgi:hypothetical protein